MPRTLAPGVREAIIADLKDGLSQGASARRHKVGLATVNRISHELERNGTERAPAKVMLAEAPGAKAAVVAALASGYERYTAARRQQTLDMAYARVEESFRWFPRPADLRHLVIALAVLEDKFRQIEAGEAGANGSGAIIPTLDDDIPGDSDPGDALRGRVISISAGLRTG